MNKSQSILVALGVILSLGSLEAREQAREPAGELRQVGTLACSAQLADDPKVSDRTVLDCRLTLDDDLKQVAYEGTLVGSGLWLVEPGPVRVIWKVLAPSKEIHTDALQGDFDVTSQHDFKIADPRENILYGGADDSVVLSLIAPRVDAISPATRLTLWLD